ncbi:MAG TPA: bifunctional diaminohydroxyphosphoribosylaminopyrimidine deaminase/5-amino-6-(5-phosphoribosylamino)uracil reductase RibD, partial [Candidatus Omnitrophota bacterium]|nr:bifunctional diaminohydroxyphosphoribosylaminopyrimidine deaminase/5-amino-6-(5-phosphoribosylamino)uracil reductase RibD [Candidatus Omnitrophota bacterium]
QMAMRLALRAQGKTSPNPMVGAVIVKNGKIISQGFHRSCGSDHAEIVALKNAQANVKGATLYVTLEPCGHYGRTPPCVDAIIASGIKKVVVGTRDPNPVNNGASIRKLNRAGIKTVVGVLQEELQKLNEPFFKFIQDKRPLIVIKWAQTLDGKIATATGSSKWITSEKTRKFSHKLRDQFDAILVGINTVIKDDPFLNGVSASKKLKKIIIDPHLLVPLRANIFRNVAQGQVIIVTSRSSDKIKARSLEKRGVLVVSCPRIGTSLDLRFLFEELGRRNMVNVLVEGGSRTIGKIIDQRLADRALIFIAPKLIGDQGALSAVNGMRVKDVSSALRLKNVTTRPIGEDILVEGYFN